MMRDLVKPLWKRTMLAVMALAVISLPARAVQPDEILPDAALEARARALSAHLRCLVCQNQSIDDSNAPLAKDLRVLVRERLQAKDSDEAVLDYVVQRYGEFVLLRPPFKMSTWLLWFSPLLFLIGAAWLVRKSAFGKAGASQTETTPPLTEDEKARLADVLKRSGEV